MKASLMSENLHRLVYYSRNLISGDAATIASEIDAILESARRNNSPCGITGALLFNGGVFAQVLEGDRSAIEATFEKIQRDRRHGDVQVLAFEEIQARTFPLWSMGYVGRSAGDRALFSCIGEETGFDERRLEGERVLEIIHSIAIEDESIAA